MGQTKPAGAKRQGAPRRDLLGSSVGRRIRARRTELGLSLAQLGGEELSRSFLSLVESGRSRISLRALAIVAERLESPLSYFLEDEEGARVTDLMRDYAEIELERDKPDEAIKILETKPARYGSDATGQWLLGRAYLQKQDHQQAAKALERALALAEARHDNDLAGEISYSLGMCHYTANNYEAALAICRSGLEKALNGENSGLQVRLFIAIGHCLYVLNRSPEAISHYERAQELLDGVYDLAKIGAVFSAMSLTARKMGDLDAALRYSKRSVATYRLRRDWKLVANELNNMAMRYKERGELDVAIERGREAVQRAVQAGSPEVEAFAHATLAAVYLQRQDLDEAEREATLAESLAGGKARLPAIDAWLVRAEIAAERDDWDTASSLYRKALQELSNLKHRTRLNDSALRYSELLRQRGDLEGALEMAVAAATGVLQGD